MRYRFIGTPTKKTGQLKTGYIYDLVVVTSFFFKQPVILTPFYLRYKKWEDFYMDWIPVLTEQMLIEIMLMKLSIDKRKKSIYN